MDQHLLGVFSKDGSPSAALSVHMAFMKCFEIQRGKCLSVPALLSMHLISCCPCTPRVPGTAPGHLLVLGQGLGFPGEHPGGAHSPALGRPELLRGSPEHPIPPGAHFIPVPKPIARLGSAAAGQDSGMACRPGVSHRHVAFLFLLLFPQTELK